MYFVWLTSCNCPEFSQTCPAWIKISFCVLQYLASRYIFHPQNPESTQLFQFQTWNVRLLHWQSQFTYWEAACKLFFAHIWKTEQLVFGKLSSSSYVQRNRDQHLKLWTQFKQYPPCCLWLCSMPPLCCEGLLTLEASQIEWRLSSWTGLRVLGRRKRWRGRGCVLSGVGPRT